MTSIRYYNDYDYEDIKKILQEGNLYDETWETRENLKNKIKKDPESILIAENDSQIVGCVFIMEDGWNAFIWRLCVKKDRRKEGIGLLLMQKSEEIIRARGIKESGIFVDTKNDMLKEWYKKQNYQQGRDWTFMYKDLKD